MRLFANGAEKLKGWSGTMGSTNTDTALLLHMDGANGSNTFIDSSLNALSVTIAAGTPTISTTQAKFGQSGSFSTNQAIAANSWNTVAPTSAYTIDFWAYPTSVV